MSLSLKKGVKSVLHKTGLIGPSEYIYFNLKTLSPAVLKDEIEMRRGIAKDGYALPPAKLIYDIIACRWASVYLHSGQIIVDDMEALLAKNDENLSNFRSVLDFGCGSGRLIRQVQKRNSAELLGSDYNASLIKWCDENLPFARFNRNDLAPPIDRSDDSIDFIYARSVFTHLPLDLTLSWIAELKRVLKSGGYIYFTMHGRPMSGGLNPDQYRQLEQGKLVETYSKVAGENLCSTFALRSFVTTQMIEGFEEVDFLEGRDQPHLKQDIYLLRKI